MPKLAPELLNSIFYLYRTVDDAKRGVNPGGTGFLIAFPTKDHLGHHYGITNWHVAIDKGFSVIRINTKEGPEYFDLGPEDWFYNRQKDDVAVTPLDLRNPEQITWFLGTQLLLSEKIIKKENIGPGDDVFMIGLFVDLDTSTKNIPALRF
jgi:hypothetical protein